MLTLWTNRLITFLLWAIAAGGVIFWILQTMQQTSANTKPAAVATIGDSQDAGRTANQMAKVLGANQELPVAENTAPKQQTRFQLVGVLAGGPKSGAALIATDGKPAKPYRVGAAVEEGLQVLALEPRSASLGTNGNVLFTLELPARQ